MTETAGSLLHARSEVEQVTLTSKAHRDAVRRDTGVCVREHRAKLSREAMERHEAIASLAYRLHKGGQVTDEEAYLLSRLAEQEWDDAIHVASPGDPLTSLCGQRGRNLADLPEIPDGWGGCWTCIDRALDLIPTARDARLTRAQIAELAT